MPICNRYTYTYRHIGKARETWRDMYGWKDEVRERMRYLVGVVEMSDINVKIISKLEI